MTSFGILVPLLLERWITQSHSFEHQDFVSKAISEMVEEGAASMLPSGARPMVISPLNVLPKQNSDKLRFIVNMRYVNEHIIKRVFKFE